MPRGCGDSHARTRYQRSARGAICASAQTVMASHGAVQQLRQMLPRGNWRAAFRYQPLQSVQIDKVTRTFERLMLLSSHRSITRYCRYV
jgi:hypothetical protein